MSVGPAGAPLRWPRRPNRDTRRQPASLDLDWPHSDQAMMDALLAAPRVIDESALPPALAVRRARATRITTRITGRQYAFGVAAFAAISAFITGVVGLTPALMHALSAPTAAVSIAAAIIAATACAAAAAALGILIKLAIGPIISGSRYIRHDRAQLRAARTVWPTSRPTLLTEYPYAAALAEDWNRRFASGDPHHRGAAALVWPEPNMVAMACVLASNIRRTETWTTPLLDNHRVRIDLDATLARITVLAHRRWRLTRTAPDPTAPDIRHDWGHLIDVIDELADYTTTINGLDAALRRKAVLDVDAEDTALAYEFLSDPDNFDRDDTRAELSTSLHHTLNALADRLQHLKPHLLSSALPSTKRMQSP